MRISLKVPILAQNGKQIVETEKMVDADGKPCYLLQTAEDEKAGVPKIQITQQHKIFSREILILTCFKDSTYTQGLKLEPKLQIGRMGRKLVDNPDLEYLDLTAAEIVLLRNAAGASLSMNFLTQICDILDNPEQSPKPELELIANDAKRT